MKKFIISIGFILSLSYLASCTHIQHDTSSLSYLNKQVQKTQNKLIDLKTTMNIIQEISDITLPYTHRAVGSPGIEATLNHLTQQLTSYGLQPKIHSFPFQNKKGNNLFVDIPGESDEIVMLGAHYDSVEFGPGINDNATGVAILLSLAKNLTENKIKPKKTIRLAFWDAEEKGAIGSQRYVQSLSKSDISLIKQYLNVDMVGTKGGTAKVLDAGKIGYEKQKQELIKKSISPENIDLILQSYKKLDFKEGSLAIEQNILETLKTENFPTEAELLFTMQSDSYPLSTVVPTGAFSMVELTEEKNGALSYAPCYHQNCDTIDKVDLKVLNTSIKVINNFIKKFAL